MDKALACHVKSCEFDSRLYCICEGSLIGKTLVFKIEILGSIPGSRVYILYLLFVYYPIIIFLFMSFLISFVVFLASYLLTNIKMDIEKLSSYECGFEPFNDARKKIDIRFYLIAILFIIFDLEIAYLIPWALDYGFLNNDAFLTILAFLFLLTLGFIYEWKKGALDWE